MGTTKKTYNKDWAMWKYLKHFRDYTGNKEITPKDMFYAMNWLIEHHKLNRVGSDTSRVQLDYLWDRIMGDAMDSYSLKELFFKLVQQSIDSRKEPQVPEDYDYEDEDYSTCTNPEEDMDSVSQQLLKQDDVFFEDSNDDFLSSYKKYLYESLKASNRRNLLIF